MGTGKLKTITSKAGSFLSQLKDNKQGSLPAIAVLLMLGLILVFFNLSEKIDSPVIESGDGGRVVNKGSATSTTLDPDGNRLNSILEAMKTTPFKAKVTTEDGFRGYWTQDGENYRFDDPTKSNFVILNSSKKKLWVANLGSKVAYETPLDTSKLEYLNKLIPVLLIEGLSTSTATGTKKLEDILPRNKGSRIVFNTQGLPDRWDGFTSNGSACFIDWDYVQLNNVLPSEFDLPQGLKVNILAPNMPIAGTAK